MICTKTLAKDLKKYADKYECSLFRAAEDMDEPISIEEYRKAFEILGEPISEDDLKQIGAHQSEVNAYREEEEAWRL